MKLPAPIPLPTASFPDDHRSFDGDGSGCPTLPSGPSQWPAHRGHPPTQRGPRAGSTTRDTAGAATRAGSRTPNWVPRPQDRAAPSTRCLCVHPMASDRTTHPRHRPTLKTTPNGSTRGSRPADATRRRGKPSQMPSPTATRTPSTAASASRLQSSTACSVRALAPIRSNGRSPIPRDARRELLARLLHGVHPDLAHAQRQGPRPGRQRQPPQMPRLPRRVGLHPVEQDLPPRRPRKGQAGRLVQGQMGDDPVQEL